MLSEFSDIGILGERLQAQGYQLGIEETHEELLQTNFNLGFVQGVPTRFNNGLIRGMTTGALLANMFFSSTDSQGVSSLSSLQQEQQEQHQQVQQVQQIKTNNTQKSTQLSKSQNTIDDDFNVGGNNTQMMSASTNLPEKSAKSTLSFTHITPFPVERGSSCNGQEDDIIFALFILFTAQTKQLGSKQPLDLNIIVSNKDNKNNTSNIEKQLHLEPHPLHHKLLSTKTSKEFIQWLNSFPSGQWGSLFAKLDPNVNICNIPIDERSSSILPNNNHKNKSDNNNNNTNTSTSTQTQITITKDLIFEVCQTILKQFNSLILSTLQSDITDKHSKIRTLSSLLDNQENQNDTKDMLSLSSQTITTMLAQCMKNKFPSIDLDGSYDAIDDLCSLMRVNFIEATNEMDDKVVAEAEAKLVMLSERLQHPPQLNTFNHHHDHHHHHHTENNYDNDDNTTNLDDDNFM